MVVRDLRKSEGMENGGKELMTTCRASDEAERPEGDAMTATQGTLFGVPPVVAHGRCDYGGGVVVVERTDDHYEDRWHCMSCPSHGNLSHSRVFGPRHEEEGG